MLKVCVCVCVKKSSSLYKICCANEFLLNRSPYHNGEGEQFLIRNTFRLDKTK